MSAEIDLAQPHTSPSASSIEHAPKNTSAATNGKGKQKEVYPQPSDTPNAPAEVPSTNDRDIGSGRWPLEHFPPPPPDGNWKPKHGGKLVNKIPRKKTGLPPAPTPTLNPPLMALTYPPPPPLSENTKTWLPQMVGDVQRQRSHLEIQLALAQAEATEALVDATLANTELNEEMRTMQTFLDRVAHVAGNGFVRRLISEVDHLAHHFDREEEAPSDDAQEEEDPHLGDDEHDDADEEDDSEEDTTSDEDDSDKSSGDEDDSKPNDSNGPPPPGGSAVGSGASRTRAVSPSPEPVPRGNNAATAPQVESPRPPQALEDDAQSHSAVNSAPTNPSLPATQPESDLVIAVSEIPASSSRAPEADQPVGAALAPSAARSGESIRAEFLAQLSEPLNITAVVPRGSRVVGPMNRIIGIQSSVDHGKERRKRAFLDEGSHSDSSNESGDANSSQQPAESPKKRAKTAHQPGPSPPRKRSHEVLQWSGTGRFIDSEEEVSVQVTPRAGRDDSLLQVCAPSGATGKCRLCGDEDGGNESDTGRRSPKRRRKDGPSTTTSATPKGGWLNWLMGSSPSRQPEASSSTSAPAASPSRQSLRSRLSSSSQSPAQGESSSMALVPFRGRRNNVEITPLCGLRLSAPRAPSVPNSPSSSQAVVVAQSNPPANDPPAASSASPTVGRRRPRPLRRDPWRLRENAFRDPILYRVDSESP